MTGIMIEYVNYILETLGCIIPKGLGRKRAKASWKMYAIRFLKHY